MKGLDDFVKVHIRCNRCGHVIEDVCVPVDRNVPEEFRCQPGRGGSGRPDIRCPGCNGPCFEDFAELQRAVATELTGGWGRHQKRGAVFVECRG